jgi:hypothetical protein
VPAKPLSVVLRRPLLLVEIPKRLPHCDHARLAGVGLLSEPWHFRVSCRSSHAGRRSVFGCYSFGHACREPGAPGKWRSGERHHPAAPLFESQPSKNHLPTGLDVSPLGLPYGEIREDKTREVRGLLATPAGVTQGNDFRGLPCQTSLTAHFGAQGFFDAVSNSGTGKWNLHCDGNNK